MKKLAFQMFFVCFSIAGAFIYGIYVGQSKLEKEILGFPSKISSADKKEKLRFIHEVVNNDSPRNRLLLSQISSEYFFTHELLYLCKDNEKLSTKLMQKKIEIELDFATVMPAYDLATLRCWVNLIEKEKRDWFTEKECENLDWAVIQHYASSVHNMLFIGDALKMHYPECITPTIASKCAESALLVRWYDYSEEWARMSLAHEDLDFRHRIFGLRDLGIAQYLQGKIEEMEATRDEFFSLAQPKYEWPLPIEDKALLEELKQKQKDNKAPQGNFVIVEQEE